jgi:hypothetical protein
VATSPVAGHQPPAPEPQRGRNGRTLLVLRGHQRAVQQGRGTVYGADVCRLPGHPWPWRWPVPGDDPGGDAGGLDLLPTGALEQKAAANRHVIAVMRERLAAGEQVARMYQEPGLAWLERQA